MGLPMSERLSAIRKELEILAKRLAEARDNFERLEYAKQMMEENNRRRLRGSIFFTTLISVGILAIYFVY